MPQPPTKTVDDKLTEKQRRAAQWRRAQELMQPPVDELQREARFAQPTQRSVDPAQTVRVPPLRSDKELLSNEQRKQEEAANKRRQAALDEHLKGYADDPVSRGLATVEFRKAEKDAQAAKRKAKEDEIGSEYDDPLEKAWAISKYRAKQRDAQSPASRAFADRETVERIKRVDQQSERLDQQGLGNAFLRESQASLSNTGRKITALVARGTGSGEAADELYRDSNEFGAARQQAREGDMSPWLSRMYGGASESLLQMAATPGGAYSKIVGAGVMSGSEALTTAEDAGLEGTDRLRYAGTQALFEAGIAAIGQKLFGAGVESRLAGQAVASQTWKALAKNVGMDALKEMPEEALTAVLQDLSSKFEGVSPDMTFGEFVTNATEAAVQAAMMGPMVNAPNAASLATRTAMRAFQQKPSKTNYDLAVSAGMPPIENPNRDGRTKLAADLNAAAPAAEPQPADPVTGDRATPAAAAPVQPVQPQPPSEAVSDREQEAIQARLLREYENEEVARQEQLQGQQAQPETAKGQTERVLTPEVPPVATGGPSPDQSPKEADPVSKPETAGMGLVENLRSMRFEGNRQQRTESAQQAMADASDGDLWDVVDSNLPSFVRDAAHQIRKSRPSMIDESTRRSQESFQSNEEAHTQRQELIKEQSDQAHDALTHSGFTLEHQSKSGSKYYRRGEQRIRIADHDVPLTGEREHNAEQGGFTWSGQGIVLPVKDVESALSDHMGEPAPSPEPAALEPAALPEGGSIEKGDDGLFYARLNRPHKLPQMSFQGFKTEQEARDWFTPKPRPPGPLQMPHAAPAKGSIGFNNSGLPIYESKTGLRTVGDETEQATGLKDVKGGGKQAVLSGPREDRFRTQAELDAAKQSLPAFLALPQKSQDLFNKAFESKDTESLKQMVAKNNVAWNSEFQNRTGIKLPKTMNGRSQAVLEWAAPPVKSIQDTLVVTDDAVKPEDELDSLNAQSSKMYDEVERLQAAGKNKEANALIRDAEKLSPRIKELEAPRIRAKQDAAVAEEEERRKRYNEKEDARKQALPTKQTRNGWELATDGTRWYLRDPNTKEIVYDGKLARVREVADEGSPDAPQSEAAPEATTAKEPWQMTRDESVGQYKEPFSVKQIQEAEKKSTGARKRFQRQTGAMVPPSISGEVSGKISQQEATAQDMKDAYRKYVNEYKQKAEDHYTAVEKAVKQGKPVPPEVLKDYPDLVPPVHPKEPAKAEVIPEEESLRREWQRLDKQVVFEEGALSSLRTGRDVRGKITEEKTAKWRADVAVKEREFSELKARAKAAQKAYLDARAKTEPDKGTVDVRNQAAVDSGKPEALSSPEPLSGPKEKAKRKQRVKAAPAADKPAAVALDATIDRVDRVIAMNADVPGVVELQEAVAAAKTVLHGALRQRGLLGMEDAAAIVEASESMKLDTLENRNALIKLGGYDFAAEHATALRRLPGKIRNALSVNHELKIDGISDWIEQPTAHLGDDFDNAAYTEWLEQVARDGVAVVGKDLPNKTTETIGKKRTREWAVGDRVREEDEKGTITRFELDIIDDVAIIFPAVTFDGEARLTTTDFTDLQPVDIAQEKAEAEEQARLDEQDRIENEEYQASQGTTPEPAQQIDRPLVATTRAEWDREIKTRLRSIMSEVDYENADIERDEGIDAISRAIGFLDDNNRTYDKGALSRFENQSVTDMPEDGLSPDPSTKPGLPWRNASVEDESRWYMTEVTVKPSSRREKAYGGIVVRVLNQGDLVEVRPHGQEGTFRVSSDRITLVEEVDRLQPPRLPKAQEPAASEPALKAEPETVETPKPIEQPAIPEFKRTTPDKSSITRQDRDERISKVRESIVAVESRMRAKQKEHDGFRSNATKKRGDARQEIRNLESRLADLTKSIRRDELNSRIAALEDAMESPRSYDHYLAGMMSIHKANADMDEAAWRDGSSSREASQKGYTAKEKESDKFRDELFARAVGEGKVQGLDESDAKQAALSAVSSGFSVLDDRPLSYFVERAADRIREQRMAMPMGKLFPNQSVYRGEKTTLTNEQRDQFAEQLREASKDDKNATAKISAINKKIDQAIQAIKDTAAAEAKKKTDAAAEEKAKVEQEKLKNARERAKRYFQEERISKALKTKTVKTKPVFVGRESEGGPVKIVEGVRTDGDKKGELYPNGLILHPSFAEDSTDFALTHERSGLAFPSISTKSDMKAMIGLIDVLGIDFNVDVDAEGQLPSDLLARIKQVNTAWQNDDYSALSELDRAKVEKLAAVTPTDIQADLILTADDLGANGIPPGMGTVMTDRGVKAIKDMANEVAEFAYDPVFTFQDGKLVFRDGYTFKFTPQLFNLHPSELKEGQTVGINLEDLGIKRATPQDVVAEMLKNAGLPKVTKSKSGRDVTAGYVGATASVHQGEQDNDWSVVSGNGKVRDVVIATLEKIRWRQPGQTGDPSTDITEGNQAKAVVEDEQTPAETPDADTAMSPMTPARRAALKAREELRQLHQTNRQYFDTIQDEWNRIVQSGVPTTGGIPLTAEMAKAIAGLALGKIRAGFKTFDAFIKELRANKEESLAEGTIVGLKNPLIRTWNAFRETYGLDEATPEAFDAGMSAATDEVIAEAVAQVENPEPAAPAGEPEPAGETASAPTPEAEPDDEPTIGIKKAKRAERLEELGLEQEDIVNKVGHSFPELDAEAKTVSPGEAESVFTRIGEGGEAADNASDRDVFVMLNHVAKKQVITNQTQEELEAARAAGDDFKVAELEAALSVQVAEEARLMAIAKNAGTAAGRALAAFKALLKHDMSLARLRMRLDAAADGKPTADQTRKLNALHAKYEAAVKELEAKTKEAEAATTRAEIAEQIVRDMEAKAKLGKTKADRRLEAALNKLGKDLSFFSLEGALKKLPELIELAGAIIEKGAETFQQFLDRFSDHLGRRPKPETIPVLQQAWDTAWDLAKNPKPPEVSIEPDHPESLVSAAKALFRYVLSQGITDTDTVIDLVHEELQNQFPDEIGERLDTMKAIVDYDKVRTLSQDPLDILVADKHAVVQMQVHLAKMLRGMAANRIQQRHPVSDEQREHRKLVAEAKRKGGFVVTDPERQATSALASLETRLRHSISDTLNEIANGARTVPNKTAGPTSDTTEDLQAYLALVRGMHKAIFGDRQMTQEQRLKAAEAAAVKNEAYWNDRLARAKAGDFSTGKTKPNPVTNANIAAIKARSELAKAQVHELQELAKPKPDPEAISDARYLTSLQNQLSVKLARMADIVARAAAGDFAPERNLSKEKREANAQRRKSDASIRDARITLDETTRELNDHIEQVRKKNLTYVDLALRVPGAAWATLRDLKLTGELSFILRQGGPRVFGALVPAGKILRGGLEAVSGNTDAAKRKFKQAGQGYKQLAGTLGKTLRAMFWKTDTELARAMDALKQRPNYRNGTYEAMKLGLHEDGGKFSVAEELFINNLIELGGLALDKRFPGFKGFRDGNPVVTQTAHNLNVANRISNATKVFMNEIRADIADDAAAVWTMKSGEMTPAEARSLGSAVNAFTGKGDMGLIGMDGKMAMSALNKVLISAPWLMSRIQMLTGHPFWSRGSTGETRKAAAEMYVDMAAGVAAFYGAVLLAGMFMDDDEEKPVVETDTTSADYRKVRIGKTRLDPLFGLQQLIVLASRIYHNEIKDSRGVVRPRKGFEDDWELFSRFQEGRLHPAIQDIRSLKTGRDFIGQPITKQQVAIGAVTPITYPAIMEASKNRGLPASTALAIWAMAGGSLTTYQPRIKERSDVAEELRSVHKKLRNPNTPAEIRKSLQSDYETMLEGHLVNAVKYAANDSGDTALAEQAATHKPGSKKSQELTAAIEKERFDIILNASARVSTDAIRRSNDEKLDFAGTDDKGRTVARSLVPMMFPDVEEAIRLYDQAYKAKNKTLFEWKVINDRRQQVVKPSVASGRARIRQLYTPTP